MIQQTILPFKLEITRENLTAHGGLAVMAEFNQAIGLGQLINQYLPAPGSNRGYQPASFVNSLVTMLQGGGQHLEDLRELEREKGLLKLAGQQDVPNPDTVGDWLRRMGDPQKGQKGLKGLDQVRSRINQRILRQDKRTSYTLDADATQIESWKQDAAFTYQSVKGYMPMLGFLFELPLCIYDEFREGNVPPASEQLSFYRQCRKRMPRGKRIARYRADSASYQADLFNELESDGVTWAVTAVQDKAVKEVIASLPGTAWREPQPGCGYEIAEAVHSMGRTDAAFRLVIKREVRRQGELFAGHSGHYFYHAIASNWPEGARSAYEVLRWHNQRGQAENFNKELKSGFGVGRLPCGESFANAVFLRIGALAYNLFIGFKYLACPESWLPHTIATFRWRLFQVAGRIVRHAGRLFLKLAVGGEILRLFREIRRRCFSLGAAFASG